MLNIEDLHVEVDGKEILHGLDLRVPSGEVHAVMGPNGSGKSTLAYTLAGREGYVVTRGRVLFQGHDLTAMKPEERAQEGVFLAFQYPVEIPGVSNANFLKSAVNAVRRHRGELACIVRQCGEGTTVCLRFSQPGLEQSRFGGSEGVVTERRQPIGGFQSWVAFRHWRLRPLR